MVASNNARAGHVRSFTVETWGRYVGRTSNTTIANEDGDIQPLPISDCRLRRDGPCGNETLGTESKGKRTLVLLICVRLLLWLSLTIYR